MQAYAARRLGLLVLNVILVSILVFLFVQVLPGDAVIARAEDKLSPERIQALREQLGLNRPLHEQYLSWISGVMRGDLHVSMSSGRPVREALTLALPVTLELSVLAVFVALAVGLPVAVVSALRPNGVVDYVARTLAISGISVPSFWLATIAIGLLVTWFGVLPPLRYVSPWDDPVANLQQFFLPSLILGLALAGTTMRMARTSMLEVLRQDYIRTAWAKGVKERVIVSRHVLRNALIPIVAILGVDVAGVLSGSVVIESIFNLPGVGNLMYQAITARDIPMILAINLFGAAAILFVNFLVDLSMGWIDPRIRYG